MLSLATMPPEDVFVEALRRVRERWPSDGYYTTTKRFILTYRLLMRFCSGRDVVDVGAWPGDFALALAEAGFSVTVVDKDLDRSTRKSFNAHTASWVLTPGCSLREKCTALGIRAFEVDIERDRFPFCDGAVDCVIFTDVIGHLHLNPLHSLREIKRILSDNGCVLITSPNLLTLRNRLSFLLGRADYDTMVLPYDAYLARETVGHPGQHRVYSMAEMLDMLRRVGFGIEFSCYMDVSERQSWVSTGDVLKKTIKRVLLACIPSLRNMIVVVANKRLASKRIPQCCMNIRFM